MVFGNEDAQVTIEVFTDFQCPYCGTGDRVLMRALQAFPKSVKLRHRDYPLDSSCNRQIRSRFHQDACRAARYARCAARQGKFWKYRAKLFANQRALSAADLQGYAKGVGLDRDLLLACVGGRRSINDVKADIEEGIARGVRGTPAYYLDGEKVSGARTEKSWKERIARALGR